MKSESMDRVKIRPIMGLKFGPFKLLAQSERVKIRPIMGLK